jgi:outer membrane protein assembly factor BamB
MTAGFRIADGATRWRRPGYYSCTTLPCPGESQAGYSLAGAPAGVPELGLRVVTRGTLSYPASASDDSRPAASCDARATIQGFALRTGRTRWSFDAGRNMSLIQGTATYAFTDSGSIAIRDARGRLRALDLVRGSHRAISATTSGWCRRAVEYRQDTPYETDDGPIRTHAGQPSLFPCAVGTRRARDTPAQVPHLVGEIGARNAGLIAWSAPSAVLAAAPAARAR